ncbi:MAG: allophanate hydrolase subunit 1 [Actinomycetota bacterium]
MHRRPYGPTAWWIDGITDAAAYAAGVAALRHPGLIDVVPTESTVVVHCAPGAVAAIGEMLDDVVAIPTDVATQRVEIPVHYDGDDLVEVADRVGIEVDEVIRRHTAAQYRVAFCGFSPGFAYLVGLDPLLELPRRDRPRVAVPTGAVAIAAHYSAVYPSPSPGGWHLLGHTDAVVWDVAADPPARLAPGTPVQFVAVDP